MAYGYVHGQNILTFSFSQNIFSLLGRLRRAAPGPHHSRPHSYEPSCEVLTKQVCEKIPIKTPKYIEVPVCVPVPHYECEPIIREVPDTECVDEAYHKCHKVPNQVGVALGLGSMSI